MNILVIGNGFDLAHGLPTKYGDFLKWIEVARKKINKDYTLHESDWKDVDSRIRIFMEKETKNLPFFLTEPWKDMITENVLIDYFIRSKTYQKKNWIDFEAEVSNLVQVLEVLEERMDEGGSFTKLKKSQKKTIIQIFPNFKFDHNRKKLVETLKSIDPISHIDNLENIIETLDKYIKFDKTHIVKLEQMFGDMDDFRVALENDLNDLVVLLEKYLSFFCLNSGIKKFSPDIKNLDIDKILSFNYTDTYKLYERKDEKRKAEFDFVHGKVQIDSINNNMVLGIDEYLPNDKKDCNIKYIAFKKYYQRICKGTGNKNKEWIDKIRNDEKEIKRKLKKEFPKQIPINKYDISKRHNLYFFGHSLDVTDKDIIKNFILHDNVFTTIYYHKTYDDRGNDDNGRRDLSSKIANLVKVIGQDELIRRTGGSTKTIEFKLQQDMVERK